jgi:hypothetical protein
MRVPRLPRGALHQRLGLVLGAGEGREAADDRAVVGEADPSAVGVVALGVEHEVHGALRADVAVGGGGLRVRGARIDVYHVLHDGRRLVKTGLKTRIGGGLTLILPRNLDTRRIVFAYRALRPGPITSRQTLRLTVKRHGRAYVRARR